MCGGRFVSICFGNIFKMQWYQKYQFYFLFFLLTYTIDCFVQHTLKSLQNDLEIDAHKRHMNNNKKKIIFDKTEVVRFLAFWLENELSKQLQLIFC